MQWQMNIDNCRESSHEVVRARSHYISRRFANRLIYSVGSQLGICACKQNHSPFLTTLSSLDRNSNRATHESLICFVDQFATFIYSNNCWNYTSGREDKPQTPRLFQRYSNVYWNMNHVIKFARYATANGWMGGTSWNVLLTSSEYITATKQKEDMVNTRNCVLVVLVKKMCVDKLYMDFTLWHNSICVLFSVHYFLLVFYDPPDFTLDKKWQHR